MQDLQALDNDQLMAAYKENHQLEYKQELTMRYLDVVKKIAMQMRNVYLNFSQMDDIINESIIAVMNGIDKFDPSLNVKFETYISRRIRGLIIDMARKQDWIPRSVRQSAKEMDRTAGELYTKLGRQATDEEMAGALNMTVSEYQETVGKTSLLQMLSLDGLLEEASDSVTMNRLEPQSSMKQPEEQLLQNELKETLVQAIDQLKDREKLVISLYYQQELNMKEIAKVLEISEPRVSQIHAGALRKMRTYLEKQM